jgi:hypothetical protein
MPSSLEKWSAATQPESIVTFFRGMFDSAGVRVTDTGEAFTGRHLGNRIEFTDGIDEDTVDFVVEIETPQVDRMLEHAARGVLDEGAKFRIMAELAAPATQAALRRPVIKSRLLRAVLFRIGSVEPLMHVALVPPPGETEVAYSLAYVDGQTLVIPGRWGRTSREYRLSVDDAVLYQRRMLAARKANHLRTWLAFARWYGKFRKRVAVPHRA